MADERRASGEEDQEGYALSKGASEKLMIDTMNFVDGMVKSLEETPTFNAEMDKLSDDMFAEYFDFMSEQFYSFREIIENKSKKLRDSFDEKDIVRLLLELVQSKLDLTILKRSMSKQNDNKSRPEGEVSVLQNQKDERSELRSFAERLEHHRKAAGLSQRALSARAGLEQSHVSQLERSLAEPRLHTLINLADALGIDPCALIPKGRGRG